MCLKQKWYTVTDGGWCSIDFAISENKSENNKPMLAMQIYSTEYGDNDMIGNIYIEEDSLDELIKNLINVKKQFKLKT